VNRLYFGDNLEWLRDRREFPDASVDLVYLDPPFNSNADYNVLFREPSGTVSQAQFHAFIPTGLSGADDEETKVKESKALSQEALQCCSAALLHRAEERLHREAG
jgi:16S rRNA G966 N2-methylase RsmD